MKKIISKAGYIAGGAIKGHIVDVFLENEEACREWGRRKVKVRVYK
jgi:3D (Asp-Asp-Asp) domain-containing protein